MNKDGALKAVLFDAGGVLMDIKARPEGFSEVARLVDAFLARSSGVRLGEARILSDLEAAAAAYSSWKYAQSRRARPREITHREFWEDFVASDWPLAAQKAVAAHASDLSWAYETSVFQRSPMEGALTVLKAIKSAGLKTGVVSNSLVGGAARSNLREFGLAEYLDVQLYSDETGLRKPNPEMFNWAATSLSVSLRNTWYLGDRVDRDVLAGRRAGIGKVILFPDQYAQAGPVVEAQADVVIIKLTDLLALLSIT